VDAGNFAEIKDFEPWKETEFIYDMMAKCGTEVVTIGDREMVAGLKPLKGLLSRDPGIKVVSANITDKSGNLLWDKYAIFDKAGIKVGVTAVTGASAYSFNLTRGIQKSDDFGFKDSRESLREVIPELRKKVDVVVVLLHETPGDARRIVDEIPGMDVVVVGHNPGYMFNPDRIGSTLIVRGGNRGQYLAVTELTLDQDHTIVDYNGEGKPLGKTVAKDPELERIVTEYQNDRKAREAEAKRKKAVDDAMLQGTEHFLGAEKCQRCHSDEYTAWAESGHAKALLAKFDQDLPIADGVDAKGVQCEHCHGLGTFHGTPEMVTKVDEKLCRSCHQAEGAEDFDYAAVLARGVHN